MFRKKKDVAITVKRPLNDEEVSRLFEDAVQQFPSLENALGEALSNTKVFACTVAASAVIYITKRLPVLIDVDGRNDLYPTLRTYNCAYIYYITCCFSHLNLNRTYIGKYVMFPCHRRG